MNGHCCWKLVRCRATRTKFQRWLPKFVTSIPFLCWRKSTESSRTWPAPSVILPIAAPGIAATALLCVIFAWNEYFYAIQLNFAGASTMPQWVIGNVSTRGNFLAKLSAASIIACLPVVLAGWAAQKRMIRGLSMGAIK